MLPPSDPDKTPWEYGLGMCPPPFGGGHWAEGGYGRKELRGGRDWTDVGKSTIAPPQNHSKSGGQYAPRLSREKIPGDFFSIFSGTRVPPCVFSKNRQKIVKNGILKRRATTVCSINLKTNRESAL